MFCFDRLGRMPVWSSRISIRRSSTTSSSSYLARRLIKGGSATRVIGYTRATMHMRPGAWVGVSFLHIATLTALHSPPPPSRAVTAGWHARTRVSHAPAWAWAPAWGKVPTSSAAWYHANGCRSLAASVDSSRAGYFKTFQGAGVPEVDPILRSEVRERLRSKRREPFNKEMGQEVMKMLHSDSGVVPMRVLVEVSLRRTLRLTRREKKARLFFPPEALSSMELFLDQLYEAFPVEGFPHTLVARVRGGAGVAEDEEDAGEGSREFVINTHEDLKAALKASEETGHMIQLVIQGDEAAQAAMVPEYLVGMPDPKDAPTMQMLSFYKFFAEPKDPEQLAHMAKRLRALWEPFGALGRIYVAEEGMNAQMAVPSNVVKYFEAACRSLPELSNVFLNRDRQVAMDHYLSDPGFDALHIRVRNQVVADGGLQKEYDWSDCGKPMEPEEWHETVDDPNVLVFDCRNEFESEVGRFTSAEPLNTSFFRESWDVLKDRLADVPKDKPILTYCTGGIRCIKVGAWLKQELGFTNVARLEGGIISYARHLREKAAAEAATEAAPEQVAVSPQPPAIPYSKFKGINYVFDNRLGERITSDVLSRCDQCGSECDEFVNCANNACHVRFLQCRACHSRFQGCCSRGCCTAADEAKARPAPGGYPAPPPKIWYPEDDVATAPAAATLMDGGMRRGKAGSRRRAWLHPGAFQNVKLNLAFDHIVDVCEAAEEAEEGGGDSNSQEAPHLAALRADTEQVFPEGAHMVSGHVQGRLFATLARLLGAERVLEIGTFTGYSALCFAEGIPQNGSVITCEVDERAAKIATKYFGNSPHGDKIHLQLKPAMNLLQSYVDLPADERPEFDLIFIDGDKKRYSEYYDMIINNGLLSRKGLIVADNVLWKGLVPKLARQMAQGGASSLSADEYEALGYTKRQLQLTEVMHAFNMHVRADPRTEQAVLNLRDGLLFVRLKGAERTRLLAADEEISGLPPQ